MTGAFVEYCRRAQAAGEGGEDIAALFKRIKQPPAGRPAGRTAPGRGPRGPVLTRAAGSPGRTSGCRRGR